MRNADGAVVCRAKPQLTLELLAEDLLPVRWATCDEGYNWSADFLDGVAPLGLGYMEEVPVDTRLWPGRPPTSLCGGGHVPRQPAGPRSLAPAAPPVWGGPGPGVLLLCPPPRPARPSGAPNQRALDHRDLLPGRQATARPR